MTGAERDHRPGSFVLLWATLGVVLVVLLFELIIILRQAAAISSLHDQIDTACHGVVAQLDLTEWIKLCTT